MDSTSPLLIQWTIIGAIATSVSAVVAALYTWLTARLVRSQAEPNVIMYIRHDDSRPSILQIVVENIGRGLATDITFTPSRPIPAKCWGIEKSTGEIQQMNSGPLVSGIPALGPGTARRIAWGQFGGLSTAIGGEPIIVRINYKHAKKKMQEVVTKLDVASFEGTSAHASEMRELIEAVKLIRPGLNQIALNITQNHTTD
jgi:hypothetical protein